MRDEIANLVHPIFARGLRLRERLLQGEEPSFEAEQAELLGLLLSEREALRWPEFGGDAADQGGFLGARYALACWLDELFVLDSPWSQRWNENKLEVRLYATNDRAWKFWDQARLAADRTQSDALETFFIGVMLGFTGEKVDNPLQLLDWLALTRKHLRQAGQAAWRPPPGIEPGTRVPPLRGRQALQRLLLLASAALLLAVPLVAFVLARRLS
jgi:hypothetical protein